MLRKIVLTFAVLVVVLGAVLAVNTARFTSLQLQAAPLAPAPVDSVAALDRLSRALRIPTVSALPEAEVAPAHAAFHALLAESYPALHAALELERVSEHSLLYTWRGSDPELRPIVLTGHFDVVPAARPETWTHPPFGGVIADGYVWGRGALDDKSGVMSLLEAVEALVREGYRPARTIHLAFGHDEEVGGGAGAREIVERLAAGGVEPEWVMDEGGFVSTGLLPLDGRVAAVAIAEKGYLSLRLSTEQPGGHSSAPPRQTSVGVLSRAVSQLQENPFAGRLDGAGLALFRYIGPELPLGQRIVFANTWLFRPLIERRLAAEPTTDAMLRTTTAPTMFSGSDKDNVLPARAEAVVNFRLMPGTTSEQVVERVRSVIGDERVRIEPLGDFVERVAPPAPTDSEGFRTIHRTVREVYPDAVVAPWLLVATTDARHYTRLTPNVYRFHPVALTPEDVPRIHGMDERLGVGDYVAGIRFFRRLITNASGASGG